MTDALRTARVALATLLLIGTAPSTPLVAQGVDCQALRARIDAATGQAARRAQLASALRRQQAELERLQAYADTAGCNADFVFNPNPAQCDAITSRIARLQGGADRLAQQMQGGGEEDAATLSERYNMSCVAGSTEIPAEEAPGDRQVMPVDPDAAPMPQDDDDAPSQAPRSRRVRALCVRECDGGFFPITDEASSAAAEDFDRLCKALCPNTKASLYMASPLGGIETAVAVDGTPYTSLPAAFKFQKSFDATCSCKPPHQSWVETLATAEKLIEPAKGDVIVTQTMSDAMARPSAPQAGQPAPASSRKAKSLAKTARHVRLPAPPLPDPPALGALAAPPQPDMRGDDVTQQLQRDEPTL